VSTSLWWSLGDFNNDGSIDVGDLGILAANYGTGSSGVCTFNMDYAKVFGSESSLTAVTDVLTDNDQDRELCSNLGLPFLIGLALMGMMLIRFGK
jgi:hypothetical protein